ncbi:MAG: sulfatase [Planctomycetes bacterium]|nr:sulfatase [Planctomycetota bacterium]
MTHGTRPDLLALVLGLCAACGSGAGATPRNVLLITLDTTRADYLSCYGRPGRATPSLDALAAEGTRFDLAVSTASVTPVSHASILTGLYNHEHGLRVIFADGGYRLSDEAETLASVLAAHGFHTRAVHSAFPVSRFFGLERGFDVFEDLQADMKKKKGDFRWDVGDHQRRSDETTELVTSNLAEEPFFLWVHYWDPHDLARLPPGLGRYDPGARVAPGMQAFYAEEVQYMDAQIGRLFESLRARGLYEDTLVVVVADHGQGLMDHGWAGHRLLYQEQIRVPLIVRVPGAEQAAAVPGLVRTVDIFPTILDYLGLEPSRPVSGRSLRALIEGEPEAPRTAFADQINGYDWNAGMVRARPLDDFLYLAMERDWKLIYRPTQFRKSELYNLTVDPREEQNLFGARPEEACRLLQLLAEEAPWVTKPFEAPDDARPDGSAVVEARRSLSSLGYTGTEPVEAEWAWTCPAHLDQRRDEPGPCPSCGGAPLLIGR